MTRVEAEKSSLAINTEVFALTPSVMVTLYEIHAEDIAFSLGLIDSALSDGTFTFRFHNNLKLGNNSIFWQGNEYIAAPVTTQGFEISSKGILPRPTISISTSEDGIVTLGILKMQIRSLDDLIGAKVIRRRTFAKYLDEINFAGIEKPAGFAPNNYEFPADTYYIDRKSSENKLSITFELASMLEVDGIKLPGRIVTATKCVWMYRGQGCLYEMNGRRSVDVHGPFESVTLPNEAPAIANDKDELFTDILGVTYLVDKGAWQKGVPYVVGDVVYIKKNGVNYYFVCKVATESIQPPNLNYWLVDSCSKSIKGCKLRWNNKDIGNGLGALPFGGFPAVNKTGNG